MNSWTNLSNFNKTEKVCTEPKTRANATKIPNHAPQFQPKMPSPSTPSCPISETLRPMTPSPPTPRSNLCCREKDVPSNAPRGTAKRCNVVASRLASLLRRSPSRLSYGISQVSLSFVPQQPRLSPARSYSLDYNMSVDQIGIFKASECRRSLPVMSVCFKA